MKLQTPRQFYFDIFTKIDAGQLIEMARKFGDITLTQEDIGAAIAMRPGTDAQTAVRKYVVNKMLTKHPLREIPIRYAWAHDPLGKDRLKHIPEILANPELVHVTPRIDYDRWIVDCPYCAGAEMAMDMFFCGSCLNTGVHPGGPEQYEGPLQPVGTMWIPVVWPVRDARATREQNYIEGVEAV